MLSKIWNRDKFYTYLKLTHDVINGTVEHGRPYRCCVDDGERKLFQMYRMRTDRMRVVTGLGMTVFEAAGITRALRGSGIKFEVYR